MEDLVLHVRTVLNLPLKMDSQTPGRGNCFFAAICQQMERPELNLQGMYNPASLRRSVCDFALARRTAEVQQLSVIHDDRATLSLRAPWEKFFETMKKNGQWAEGPVLYCTALMLERDIAVISFCNTPSNPYMLIPGSTGGQQSAYPFMFIGNQVDLHF